MNIEIGQDYLHLQALLFDSPAYTSYQKIQDFLLSRCYWRNLSRNMRLMIYFFIPYYVDIVLKHNKNLDRAQITSKLNQYLAFNC